MPEQSGLRFTMIDEEKLCGSKRVMLDILRSAKRTNQGGWLDSVAIISLGGPWRYTDTIMKLRRMGYKIPSRPIPGKSYCQYRIED